MPSLHLNLLGNLSLILNEQPIAVPRGSVPLLGYLSLFAGSGKSVTRTRLVGTLWPDQPETQARRLLADGLYRLRRLVTESGGGEWLVADDETVGLKDVAVDVQSFRQLSQSTDTTSLQKAAELYQGDLLQDLYEEWLSAPRLDLRDTYLTLLETLTDTFQTRNDLRAALHHARRLVMAEPFRENSQQTYLRLLGRLGRRNEALAHYDYLRRLLHDELAVEPLPETQAVVAAIQREVAEHKPGPVAVEQLPFVGRAAERARGIGQVESALAGRGSLLAIEGAAGIGKSRFLRELGHSASWRGLTVLTGKASETPLASPLAPIAEALAPLIEVRRAQLESILSPETLAALNALVPHWQTLAALPVLPPEHQQYRFQQAFVALITALARLTPLLLILDDMHWADPVVWRALEAVAGQLPQTRLCLALAYRRPEIEASPGWRTLLNWEGSGSLTVISLKPLDENDFADALPADQKPEASRLWAIAGGNPFLLTGALASLAEGRAPETNVVARTAGLPPNTHTALDAAAVLGSTISFALWARLANLTPYELAEAGDVLAQRSFLQPAEAGYVFTHDLIQSSIYTSLEPLYRRGLHARAAEALSDLDPENARLRAFHTDRAGQAPQAAALYRRAAENDLSRSAYAEALTAFSRALELLPATPSRDRAELLLALAGVTFVAREGVGQNELVTETLQVVNQLGDPTLQAKAALLAGELAMKTGQETDAQNYFEQARTHAQTANNPALQGDALNLLGEVSWRLGTLPVARDYYEQQLKLARQFNDRAQEGAALEGVAFVLASTGEQAEVLKYMHESLAIRRAVGDRYREAQANNSLISALQAAGKMDQVLALGPEAVALNDSIGYARGASIVRSALGMTHAAFGNYEQARTLVNSAVAYFASVADATAEALYTGTLGYITERGGNPAEAEQLLLRSIEGLRANQAEFFMAFSQMDLGNLYLNQARYADAVPLLQSANAIFKANDAQMETQRSLALLGLTLFYMGDFDQATAIAGESWEVFTSNAPSGEDRQYYLWPLWQLNRLLGREANAQAVLAEAHTTLQQQAGLLGDPALQKQFLEQVSINRDIETTFAAQAAPSGRITVRLARADAPLGITLTDAQKVTVDWTIDSGDEDAAIFAKHGKAALRRHRLQRLLTEASTQHAAPTDSDLAAALNVARRTIERDMAALTQTTGQPAPTRRRKA